MSRPTVTEALRHLDGAARARDLIQLCGRPAVRRAATIGEIRRVAHGRYALPDCPDPLLTAARLSAVVSHESAAVLWGLSTVGRPTAAHVTVKRGRHHVSAGGARVHWADLAPGDLDPNGRITTPLRTVLDCARTLPFHEGLTIADSAINHALIGRQELTAAAHCLAGPGRVTALRVATLADGASSGPLESVLRATLLDAGLTAFVPQAVIRDEGLYARVDLADPVAKIVIEADSFEHHGHRSALVRDCWRYDELIARGWLVLRFAWEHVMFEQQWVVTTVERSYAVRGRRLRGQKSR